MVILSLRSTFYSTDAFLSRELLTFYALDLLDMCQVVNLLPFAFVSTLQTAGKKTFFFSTSVHFLAVLKQIFEQLLFLLIAIVWCLKKKDTKNRVLFSPKFLTCSVISYHIIPMHQKQKKGEGTAHTAHIDHEPLLNTPPICSPFSSFCSVSNVHIPW